MFGFVPKNVNESKKKAKRTINGIHTNIIESNRLV
jgi:hypothetical protein